MHTTLAKLREHLMPEASRSALDVAERFANGLATAQELDEARSAAYNATDYTYNAARAAAYNAARAAYAAADAARQRQVDLFLQLCQGSAPWQTQP